VEAIVTVESDLVATLMPDPPEELLSWCPCYSGEPRKRQPWIWIRIWVPLEVKDAGIGVIADYIHANTGFDVARTVGWSSGGSARHRNGGLSLVSVTVRSAQVRAKLAAAATSAPPTPPRTGSR
jgi:hypothetical protein